jgi:hypothetical protein
MQLRGAAKLILQGERAEAVGGAMVVEQGDEGLLLTVRPAFVADAGLIAGAADAAAIPRGALAGAV